MCHVLQSVLLSAHIRLIYEKNNNNRLSIVCPTDLYMNFSSYLLPEPGTISWHSKVPLHPINCLPQPGTISRHSKEPIIYNHMHRNLWREVPVSEPVIYHMHRNLWREVPVWEAVWSRTKQIFPYYGLMIIIYKLLHGHRSLHNEHSPIVTCHTYIGRYTKIRTLKYRNILVTVTSDRKEGKSGLLLANIAMVLIHHVMDSTHNMIDIYKIFHWLNW